MYKIVIKPTKHKGRGVFATALIRKGEIIEVAPVLVVPIKEEKYLDKTVLSEYYFEYIEGKSDCIVLGYGSIYNHSAKPNAEWDFDYKKQNIIFKATNNIIAGEEICTDYNPDEWKFKIKK